MLVSSPVSPRGEALTATQRTALNEYFERHHASETPTRTPLLLALVLAGDKPATHITPASWAFSGTSCETDTHFRAFLDTLGLAAHHLTGMSGWFVAPSRGRFGLLPSTARTRANAAWHRRLGIVFGYPSAAIEYFIHTDHEDRTQPKERLAAGEFGSEEMAYTEFVFYVHDDSLDGYTQAIETGKTVRARFTDLATRWDLPVLDALADEVYQEAVAVYTGDKAAFAGELIDFTMIATNPRSRS